MRNCFSYIPRFNESPDFVGIPAIIEKMHHALINLPSLLELEAFYLIHSGA